MKAATCLISGPRAEAALAETAVKAALEQAGLTRADQIILFLSHDFRRSPQPAVVAAARAGGCLAVSGCTASGLLTERGWHLERPAAAALVIASDENPVLPNSPLLCFTGNSRLPFDWQSGGERAGLVDTDAAVWSHGRIAENGNAECRLPGLQARILRAAGLRRLGDAQPVDAATAYELLQLGGQPAVASLLRALPPELRDNPPVHQITALRQPDGPAIAVISINADGSLTMAETLAAGESIIWAIRQPLAAEQEMREMLRTAAMESAANPTAIDSDATPTVNGKKRPNFALMFSCIGRGPLFYGDDDRDLQLFREYFPGVPLLGAYGTGQIAPLAGGNRLIHNTALTLLFESAHV